MDPLIPDENGNNALIVAVLSGHTTVVQRLLEIQAVRDNINATNENGDHALALAAWKKYHKIENLLLKAGAKPDSVYELYKSGQRKEKKKISPGNRRERHKLKSRQKKPVKRTQPMQEKKKTSSSESFFFGENFIRLEKTSLLIALRKLL